MSKLQKIEDFYIQKGLRQEKLRKALEKDKEYQRLLKEKKNKRLKKLNITQLETKKYVLATDNDIDILNNCKKLKRLGLTKQDKKIIELIISQLKDDWRSPLILTLKKLNKKYRLK